MCTLERVNEESTRQFTYPVYIIRHSRYEGSQVAYGQERNKPTGLYTVWSIDRDSCRNVSLSSPSTTKLFRSSCTKTDGRYSSDHLQTSFDRSSSAASPCREICETVHSLKRHSSQDRFGSESHQPDKFQAVSRTCASQCNRLQTAGAQC